MTDSERSYVTDEDVINVIDAAYKQPGPGDPLRRVLNEMIGREVEKAVVVIRAMREMGHSGSVPLSEARLTNRIVDAFLEVHPNG